MVGRPPGDSADGKQRLLDACWQLLIENAPGERLTIAAVCERAECTPPTLYHHYGDLGTLEAAASARAFLEWNSGLDAEFASIADPRERLRAYSHAYLDWAVENPDAYTILFSRPGRLGPDGSGPRFHGLIQSLSEIHGRDKEDAGLIALSLAYWCLLHGTAAMALAAPGVPREAEVATLDYVEAALTAFGPPDAQGWAPELLHLTPDTAEPRRAPRRFSY